MTTISSRLLRVGRRATASLSTLLPPLLLAVLCGCTAEADHPALRGVDLPELLPAHRFAFHGTVASGHLLSPDGHKLAWSGSSFGRATLFVRDDRTGETRTYRSRGAVQWTADSRRLLYESDTTGTENPHVFVIDTESSAEAADLTPYPGVKASIRLLSDKSPSEVLVLHNQRNPKLFDLYRIDLNTRKQTMVARNPGDAVAPLLRDDGAMLGWQASREGRVAPRLRPAPKAPQTAESLPAPPSSSPEAPRASQTPERAQPHQVPPASQARQSLPPAPPEKQAEKAPEKLATTGERKDEVVRVLGQAKDPQVVWALSNRGRDRMALVALQKTRGWETVVFEDPVADVSGAVISRVTGLPLIATAQPGYPRFEILDDKLRDELGPLLSTMVDKRFGLSIASMDRSERHMVVSLYTSTRHDSYLVNRDARTFERLAVSVPEDMTRALAETRALTIQSRDGLALPAYLTLPRGVAARGLPMVLLVHGGPWAQTPWADPLRSDDSARAQFLANRGYAVLQVDFRGSTGFGRAFGDAGIDEFGRRMQDDLVDSARWAVSQGIADPARIGIMGLSYGGYATLNALAATPRTFACGVSIGGPTDLATLIESFPPYWVDLSNWHEFVGNPKVAADRAEMTERSPLTHARDIDKPVLLIHGARDVRVRLDQSQRMEQALRAAGKPVRLVTIAEMGHVPSYWAHQQKTLRETESFFHDCLGGRAVKFEPFDWLAWIWTKIS